MDAIYICFPITYKQVAQTEQQSADHKAPTHCPTTAVPIFRIIVVIVFGSPRAS